MGGGIDELGGLEFYLLAHVILVNFSVNNNDKKIMSTKKLSSRTVFPLDGKLYV